MKKIYSLFILQLFISSLVFCQLPQTIKGHPAWIMQGNIYEVNVRQYTPEGTFNAFAKHLDRLKEMGVQTLWFMPLNPISKKDRKGTLGSYYAVSSYTTINPEFGTMTDWKNLVNTIHEKGMKVISREDWNKAAPAALKEMIDKGRITEADAKGAQAFIELAAWRIESISRDALK